MFHLNTKKILIEDLKIINKNYETLISYINNIKPFEFITIFLNDDYLNKNIYLINIYLKIYKLTQKIFKKKLLESVKVKKIHWMIKLKIKLMKFLKVQK